MPTQSLAEQYRAWKEEDEITVLAAGQYKLEVTSAPVRKGNKGPMITPVYKVAEGPRAGARVLAGALVLSENSRSIFFRQMKGFFGDQLDTIIQRVSSDEDAVQTLASMLVGRVVNAQLTVDKWEGEDRNKLSIGGISLVSVPQGGPAAPAVQVAAAPEPQQVTSYGDAYERPPEVQQQPAPASGATPPPPPPPPSGAQTPRGF